jgi:hypothetical protein
MIYDQNLVIGAAAPHEDWPHGGIRISGTFCPTAGTDAMYNAGSTAAVTGAYYASVTANIPPLQLISPTGYGISTVTCANSMFNSSGIRDVAAYFRRFRFRKLNMIYNGAVGSASVSSVQISYERDTNAAYSNATQTMLQSAGQGQHLERFPCWEPIRRVCLIKPEKANRDDELFFTTYPGDGMTLATQSAAVLNQYFQGGVYAINNAYITTGATTIGSFVWEFTLDLYGLSPAPGIAFSLVEKRREEELKKLASRLPQMSEVFAAKSTLVQGSDVERQEDEKKFRSAELARVSGVSRQAMATAHQSSRPSFDQKSSREGDDEEYELPDLSQMVPTPLPTPTGIPRDSRAAAVKAVEARRSLVERS